MPRDVHIVVNGMSAKTLSTVIKRCLHKDSCNTCPYVEDGVECLDHLLSDAGIALRRMQTRYDKYKERSGHTLKKLQGELEKYEKQVGPDAEQRKAQGH